MKYQTIALLTILLITVLSCAVSAQTVREEFSTPINSTVLEPGEVEFSPSISTSEDTQKSLPSDHIVFGATQEANSISTPLHRLDRSNRGSAKTVFTHVNFQQKYTELPPQEPIKKLRAEPTAPNPDEQENEGKPGDGAFGVKRDPIGGGTAFKNHEDVNPARLFLGPVEIDQSVSICDLNATNDDFKIHSSLVPAFRTIYGELEKYGQEKVFFDQEGDPTLIRITRFRESGEINGLWFKEPGTYEGSVVSIRGSSEKNLRVKEVATKPANMDSYRELKNVLTRTESGAWFSDCEEFDNDVTIFEIRQENNHNLRACSSRSECDLTFWELANGLEDFE